MTPQEQELDYLEMQADVGITKHLGGLKATNELIELCHIDRGKYVLDVGCGIGATACLIAKRYGCKVVGVDISEKMINWSKERAKSEGIEDKVEFKVADAQNLPFEEALFDAVICESVLAFVHDKRRALSEFVRVTKQGGYVGLNESSWIKAPPPAELVEYFFRTVEEAEFLTSNEWKELLERSELKDITAITYKISSLSEFTDRIRLLGLKRILRAWYLLISHYIKSPAYRQYMNQMIRALHMPKNMYKYWGYGIYVGRK